MRPGDRIAIKTSFAENRSLPFDVGGKSVSVMRIKATGTILKNLDDGISVKVAWDPLFAPRDWYFYTHLTPVVKADTESDAAQRLVDFAFRGATQDYGWFLAQPYWLEKYGVRAVSTAVSAAPAQIEPDEVSETNFLRSAKRSGRSSRLGMYRSRRLLSGRKRPAGLSYIGIKLAVP